FVSYELEPGEVRFEISHPDYEPGVCSVQIEKPAPAPKSPAAPGGGKPAAAAPATTGTFGTTAPIAATPPGAAPPNTRTPAATAPVTPLAPPLVPLRCELTAKPRTGSVRGTVESEAGKAVAGARVELIGPASQSLTTDAQGLFAVVSLTVGSYAARVEADGYLIRLVSFEVEPAKVATPQVTLLAKPKQAQVELTKQEVRIRKQIFFKSNSAEISEKSNALLSEIADVLLRNPQVKLVEIQGHTDSKGNPDLNQQLSQQRADAVRTWLVGAGIEAGRLISKGYGDTRPLVPNLTDWHRAQNRRVQFIIKEQQ
ncbi:MAG: OmpA family protein, partial [Polyangiales bacterium]